MSIVFPRFVANAIVEHAGSRGCSPATTEGMPPESAGRVCGACR